MASLTETAFYTRKGINIGIVALVVIILARAAFGYLWELWLALNPPPPPPPTVAFDILPSLNFPESTSSATFNYSLETVDGKFPNFPKIGKVYFIPVSRENILTKDRSQELAVKLGFNTTGNPITQTLKEWVDPVNNLRKLRYNISNNNFVIDYDWAFDASILENKELPDEEMIKTESKNYLANADLMPKELQNGKSLISYWKASIGEMIPAPSLSSADFVRIDFFRDDLDNYPILGEKPNLSPFYLIFSGTKDDKRRIIHVNHTFWDIQKDNFATYPLRPIEEAWNDLSNGSAYIASTSTSGSNINYIRNIYLAYYYPDTPINFLQPLYVFEGDKGFLAYTQAVDKTWVKVSRPLAE